MPAAARQGDLVARPHAHRQGRDRRPHRRPGHRRRRLRHQAVLLQRADRAPARADPPAPGQRPVVLEVGDLRMDPAGRRVFRGETEISLSRTEFALLEMLMRSPGKVLTRLDLLEHVWDDQYENRSNVVDAYVRYLRNKVDRPFGVESIETVRGYGYRLRAEPV